MNKICTDILQSQKLIELGIDVNTADMRYGYIAPYEFSDRMYDGGYDEVPYPKDFFKKNPNFSENEYDGELPAWSLSALMEFMNRNCYNISLNCNGAEWTVKFDDSETYHHITCDYSIDAAFKMVCWLKENKKI